MYVCVSVYIQYIYLFIYLSLQYVCMLYTYKIFVLSQQIFTELVLSQILFISPVFLLLLFYFFSVSVYLFFFSHFVTVNCVCVSFHLNHLIRLSSNSLKILNYLIIATVLKFTWIILIRKFIHSKWIWRNVTKKRIFYFILFLYESNKFIYPLKKILS